MWLERLQTAEDRVNEMFKTKLDLCVSLCQRAVMNCCHVRGSLGRAKHTITTTAYSLHLVDLHFRPLLSSSSWNRIGFVSISMYSSVYWLNAFKNHFRNMTYIISQHVVLFINNFISLYFCFKIKYYISNLVQI